MNGVYAKNKFFATQWWTGAEALEDFDCVVYVDDVTTLTGLESYEAAIENSWPEFIQDFSL
ncbi:MAG: hypothetical protein GX256_01610 [Fretibacterium sp.]|nr:hypothetical protein [Fretibacterium sp.]